MRPGSWTMGPDHGGRVLIYSHDTYGLGHLRRCTLIANRLVTEMPGLSVLIVTGSPRARAFPPPEGCDTIKLPSILKQPGGGYEPRTLRVDLNSVVHLRASLIDAAAKAFEPDLILVDHAPIGVGGELRPLFERLRASRERPAVVLGLRDIIDDAAVVAAQWRDAGVNEALAAVYDEVLVYGDARLPSTAVDLALDRALPGRVRHVGYLARAPLPSIHDAALRADPYVLVTAGGGGDGRDLLAAYASFLESRRGRVGFRSVVVTGPFLSDGRAREIRARLEAAGAPVEVIEFTDRLEALVDHASAVVAMAGYNTVVEVLSARTPALFVPRSAPRAEQAIRCARLARFADISSCAASDATPERIGTFVDRALAGGRAAVPTVDLGGLDATAARLAALLERKRGVRARTAI